MKENRKKKILFVHHAKTMGGAPTSMLNIIRHLDKSLFEPKILFIYDNPSIKQICEKENIDFRILDNFFFKTIYKINTYSEAKQLSWKYYLRIYPIIRDIISWLVVGLYYSKKIIKAEKTDIVHFNSLFLTDWVWGVRNLKIKKIVHVREPLARSGLGIRRAMFRHILHKFTDKILAISEDNKRRLNLPEKTIVVYNFMEEPQNLKVPEPENNGDDFIKVAFLGGDSEIKGFPVILDSLGFLERNIKILVAGHLIQKDFPYSDEKLKYVGILNNVYELLLKSDFLIFPSIVPHFAKPIIEAGMCKIPVIASDVEGMDEIVTSGHNGLLFKCGDSLELAKSINYLAKNSSVRKRFGLENYTSVYHKFGVDSNIEKIERVYLSL